MAYVRLTSCLACRLLLLRLPRRPLASSGHLPTLIRFLVGSVAACSLRPFVCLVCQFGRSPVRPVACQEGLVEAQYRARSAAALAQLGSGQAGTQAQPSRSSLRPPGWLAVFARSIEPSFPSLQPDGSLAGCLLLHRAFFYPFALLPCHYFCSPAAATSAAAVACFEPTCWFAVPALSADHAERSCAAPSYILWPSLRGTGRSLNRVAEAPPGLLLPRFSPLSGAQTLPPLTALAGRLIED